MLFLSKHLQLMIIILGKSLKMYSQTHKTTTEEFDFLFYL